MRPESQLEIDVRTHLAGLRRVVLAVSGGVDSMALLHAASRASRGPELVVATFDHGTGASARASVDLVRQCAASLGLRFECAGRSKEGSEQRAGAGKRGNTSLDNDEASLRRARWRFLHDVAARVDAPVATAHTRDDQIESVAMRIIRGAGARGLAALFAESPVRRPLIDRTRAEILAYAQTNKLLWIEDPSNKSRKYLRNRVRHDLLPAIAAVRPEFATELLEVSTRAATIRRELDALLATIVDMDEKPLRVARQTMNDIPLAARPFVWQALAGRAGVVLDRRGTARLTETTGTLKSGGRVPLSGGFELVGDDASFTFRPTPRVETSSSEISSLSVSRETRFGAWRFSPVTEATINQREHEGGTLRPGVSPSAWVAWLPDNVELALRSWQDGDRIATDSTTPQRRRVKRFFSDFRIPSFERAGWPVVLLDDEIIWIPGIRRTYAATARSGRPGVCILCERLDG